MWRIFTTPSLFTETQGHSTVEEHFQGQDWEGLHFGISSCSSCYCLYFLKWDLMSALGL